jgi:septum formation inhibitor-activating ATPase MinD
MSDLGSVRDCDRELDRLSREQDQAIRGNVKWKLRYLNRRKKAVAEHKSNLQHGDLFRVLGQERTW